MEALAAFWYFCTEYKVCLENQTSRAEFTYVQKAPNNPPCLTGFCFKTHFCILQWLWNLLSRPKVPFDTHRNLRHWPPSKTQWVSTRPAWQIHALRCTTSSAGLSSQVRSHLPGHPHRVPVVTSGFFNAVSRILKRIWSNTTIMRVVSEQMWECQTTELRHFWRPLLWLVLFPTSLLAPWTIVPPPFRLTCGKLSRKWRRNAAKHCSNAVKVTALRYTEKTWTSQSISSWKGPTGVRVQLPPYLLHKHQDGPLELSRSTVAKYIRPLLEPRGTWNIYVYRYIHKEMDFIYQLRHQQELSISVAFAAILPTAFSHCRVLSAPVKPVSAIRN